MARICVEKHRVKPIIYILSLLTYSSASKQASRRVERCYFSLPRAQTFETSSDDLVTEARKQGKEKGGVRLLMQFPPTFTFPFECVVACVVARQCMRTKWGQVLSGQQL